MTQAESNLPPGVELIKWTDLVEPAHIDADKRESTLNLIATTMDGKDISRKALRQALRFCFAIMLADQQPKETNAAQTESNSGPAQ